MMARLRQISLAEQRNLLSRSLQSGVPLAKLLRERGLTYDSLRYEQGTHLTAETFAPVEQLPDGTGGEKIPAVSFFSGAGGMDIGFTRAGFENRVSIERNDLCCGTLRLNSPGKVVIGPPGHAGDIRDREGLAEKLRGLGVKEGFAGVFHGGPPCQPFSVAANQRFSKGGANFKRKGFDDAEKGSLVLDYAWFIREFRPLAFLIENVAGITECDGKGELAAAIDELRRAGYAVAHQVINAAWYGVPQSRSRWICLGVRVGGKAPAFPAPTSAFPASCGAVFFKALDGVANHVTREHGAEAVSRYMALPYGGRDRLGRVDRLDPCEPSKTVIAGGTKGGGRSHLHPFIPRTLSVRECARLQTFPDDYVFTGAVARQFTQVGNAVPPLLACKLALALKAALD